MSDRCSAHVYDSYSFRGHSCSRKAKVQRGDRWFCGQHDPDAVKARHAVRTAEWDRNARIRNVEQAIKDARDEAADLIESGDFTDLACLSAQAHIIRCRKALSDLLAES